MAVDELRQRAESIFDEYDTHFADKPRATRDLDRLDEIIDRLEDVLESARSKLNGGEDDPAASLVDRAVEHLEIYREERAAIAEVQSEGDEAREVGHLATWANIEFHRYHRHFAGEQRGTRDLRLLDDIISELEGIGGRMEAVRAGSERTDIEEDLRTVEANLAQYEEEREAIAEIRRTASPDERASLLAVLANRQFEIYGDHFAEKNRQTRWPALLERVIANLEEILEEMRALEETLDSSTENRDNIDIVEENLGVYREELQAVKRAREEREPAELARRLGGAANQVFETYRDEYAGEDRRTRDLGQLRAMCDELYHLARQMRTLRGDDETGASEENLGVVVENLTLYQREYDEIERVQADSSGYAQS